MAETLESIAGLFGFGEKAPNTPARFAEVVSVSGDTVSVTVGSANVDAVRCCDCSPGNVVLVETMPSGALAAVAVKGYNGGSYTLPPATTSTLGGVIADGTSISVDLDGTIHASVLTCTERSGGPTWDSIVSLQSSTYTGWREEKWSDGRLTVWLYYWYNFSSANRDVTLIWPKETTPFIDTPLFSAQGSMLGSSAPAGAYITQLYNNFTKSTASTNGSIPMRLSRTGSSSGAVVVLLRADGHWA